MHVPPPRWVIAELDVDGEIDDHAALCLGLAVEDACADASTAVVVDLRELGAIGDAGVTLFLAHDAACRAAGVQLTILVCADARQERVVGAFTAAGLGDRLRYQQPPAPAPPRPAPVSALHHRRPATARR